MYKVFPNLFLHVESIIVALHFPTPTFHGQVAP